MKNDSNVSSVRLFKLVDIRVANVQKSICKLRIKRFFIFNFKRWSCFLKSIRVVLLIFLAFYSLFPAIPWTAFCSVSILNIEGVARGLAGGWLGVGWGLAGGFEGVPRVPALPTPSKPPLIPH